MLPYTDVCIALYTQCFPSVCGKKLHLRLGRDSKFLPQTLGKHRVYSDIHTPVYGKIKSIVYHPTHEFHQHVNIAEPAAILDSSRPIVIGQAR